ncbi:hypothetical protein BU23DRAFT_282207 [Bimuria novae-zelandiae CBS 107.79]|uniref:Secreted protein n=1 Tax=Bimuria novae-zelandiae CBS 107.79 TaxID=1447943 RepID=A0A6A5URQ4_9PLEO|nr:hypothetical protein BU23DRAFT_282207 [Bimuria novae-zelandiae CBS 107.79]
MFHLLAPFIVSAFATLNTRFLNASAYETLDNPASCGFDRIDSGKNAFFFFYDRRSDNCQTESACCRTRVLVAERVTVDKWSVSSHDDGQTR